MHRNRWSTSFIRISGWLPVALILIAAPGIASADRYWNSAEPGCDGSNPDYLFCDDFEDGSWIETCGAGPSNKCCTGDATCNANGPGHNNPNNDGWLGDSYKSWPDPTGRSFAVCGGAGVAGTNCTATSGDIRGNEHGGTSSNCNPSCADQSAGMNGRHDFVGGKRVDDVFIRFYMKLLPGYRFGQQKILTVENASGNYRPMILKMPGNGCLQVSDKVTPANLRQNQGNTLCMEPGSWYYIEFRVKLDTNGSDGAIQLWMDDCGPNGDQCTGPGTLRLSHTGKNLKGASQNIGVVWVEEWGNPGADGEDYRDQYIVSTSRVGPMNATTAPSPPPPAPAPPPPTPTPTAPDPPVLLDVSGVSGSGGTTTSGPLSASATVSGQAANVNMTLSGGVGPYHFNVDCNQDGTWDGVGNTSQAFFSYSCVYDSSGTKSIRVFAWDEGTGVYEDTLSVDIN